MAIYVSEKNILVILLPAPSTPVSPTKTVLYTKHWEIYMDSCKKKI